MLTSIGGKEKAMSELCERARNHEKELENSDER